MSGKSYTMKEMKNMVDYLVEHKLYGEVKGRKMWIDFANSQRTQRTWQSLKETFLKRIMPDIHNPYYKLTIEQINSFRSGYDIVDRSKNKLEIHTISDDSNSNDTNQKANEQKNNGISNEGEATAGENIKCSKIPSRSRSSADTIILDNCYENAAEIQKEFESNDNTEKPTNDQPAPTSKSLRDCITYSEPLTPMLQEVLDDFASEPEDSDREGRMEIVDTVPETDNSQDNNQDSNEIKTENGKSVATDVAKNAKGLSAELVGVVLAQELNGGKKGRSESPAPMQSQSKNSNSERVNNADINKISSVQAEQGSMDDQDNNDTESDSHTTNVTNDTPSVNDSKTTLTKASVPESSSNNLNNSNTTVDSSLPNNPEALANKETNRTESKNEDKPDNSLREVSSDKVNETSEETVDNVKKLNIDKKLDSPIKDITTKPAPGKEADKCENIDLTKEDKQLPANKDSSNTKVAKRQRNEKCTTDLDKPSTSLEKHVNRKPRAMSENNSTETKNPCLQNVSLYDQQFNKMKYNMSESSDTEQNKKETNGNKQLIAMLKAPADPVVLKSHSDSDTEIINSPPKKKSRAGVISKTERDKAISNIFGFSSGAIGSKRRRQLSRRRRTISQNNASQNNPVSHSSEWTSESDEDTYISPPRSRKNRPTRKYLKPHPAKVMSLEEDGGLFVMYGKKIYPLVKDGKIVKNYVTYLPESDSEEGEAFWKKKYEEEKKKAQELKKLLQHSKETSHSTDEIAIREQAIQSRISSSSHHSEAPKPGKEILPGTEDKKEEAKVVPPEKIMIKFTKNNEEVHLEGLWPQIHPVLEQVVQIFHKEPEPVAQRKSKVSVEAADPPKELSSGLSTPVIITTAIDSVHEKVNEIEKEIFKEIEQRDKEEQVKPNEEESNVTKSRKGGRPRKSSTSLSGSPAKRPRISQDRETKKSEENVTASQQNATATEKNVTANKQTSAETENKVTEINASENKRSSRTPRKVLNETVNYDEPRQTAMQTRRSKQKLDTSNGDEEVRYMFPPRNKRQSIKTPPYKKTNQRSTRSSSGLAQKTLLEIPSPPDNFTQHSIESTQGYQDSDVSPTKTDLRKKKKLHMSSFMIKTRNSLRRTSTRRSHPYLYCDAYNDSSNSSADSSVQVVARENSSLNTEAYRSESYQLLMPQAKNSLKILEPIDETSPIGNETKIANYVEQNNRNELSSQTYTIGNSELMTNDVGSSSNVSLPMSPELSVVENISISKEMINSILYPTINEIQGNEIKDITSCNNFVLSDVDVSVPLMQQNCEAGTSDVIMNEVDSIDPDKMSTESLLSKINTFNINEQVTATETLNQKLHNLLLDSAKKTNVTENAQDKESMMDVDASVSVVGTKTKSKKRCSTPRKRKDSRKSLAPKIAAVVEEHIEACSHSGRKSCPPHFQTFTRDKSNVTDENNIVKPTTAKEKKGRKKKDIIKVKIQRPKDKKLQENLRTKSMKSGSSISVNDSGINDTVFLPIDEDSVDLIHNHSETCLHANECVGDSVEFVDNSKSVITLGDSLQSDNNSWNSRIENDSNDYITADVFCGNAQDMKSFYNQNNLDNVESTSDGTVYHSPLGTEASINSLITEDLSDDFPLLPTKTSKWYLLSEEETTNTNLVGQSSPILNVRNFPSNLKQLFPITCNVPDLSTITEMSKENEDSRKPADNLTGDDLNSKSIFDSN